MKKLCTWSTATLASLIATTVLSAEPADKAGDPGSSAGAAPVAPTVPLRHLFDVRTKMRDGVELSSDVWLPEAEGKYPVILMRTPYLKNMAEVNFPALGTYFASRGYAFVVQDVRGRGDSGGEFNFFFQEAHDGYDSIEGLAVQPWANGRVCMMGVSYLGTVQWLAARERPPHLTCIAPTSPAGEFLNEVPAIGGAFGMGFALPYLNEVSGKISQGGNARSVDWNRLYNHRPLLTLDEALGRKMRLYREFLQHDTLDDYWQRIQFAPEDFKHIDIPVLAVTGQLLDGDQTGALFYWRGINQYSPAGAQDRYLVIGPWTHVQSFLGGAEKLGELTFGKEAIIDNKALHLAFFDRYLKGSTQTLDFPRARVYVTGLNQWRDYDRYPLPDTEHRRLYLSSGGKANSACGDGTLRWQPSGKKEPADQYRFDPKNPVPFSFEAGSDRRSIQQRPDVLVYTSEAFEQTLEITGSVFVEQYAASDAKDTDFTAVISDVYPDGRAVYLGPKPVGIVRARYRNGLDRAELLSPGKTERYVIQLGDIAHAFLPGHRVRIEISSSAFPMFNPNQNTGNPIATDTEWRTAQQRIFHDAVHPSALVLPVVSGGPPMKNKR